MARIAEFCVILLYKMKWDSEDPSIIGKTVLVGITYFDKKKKVKSREQYWGEIIAFNLQDGLKVDLKAEGNYHSLPPFKDAMRPAKPGAYELDTTKEIIEDPDFLYTIASYDE